MLVQTFHEYVGPVAYNLEHHLLDLMADEIRKFEVLSVLDRSPYEQFIVHIKQTYRRNLQRKRMGIMGTVTYDKGKPGEGALVREEEG